MSKHDTPETDGEAREILCLAGGAALIVLGAGLALTYPLVRRNARALLSGVMPELQEPFKAGIRGILPDVERFLKLKGM